MQAVILAGGLATRLGALTEATPKSLLVVAGRPFIDWQLERLESCGILRVLLCIGHLGERIREHVGDGHNFGIAVDYSEDGPVLRGTAGALRRALPWLDPEFLVTYGDSYLTFDYAALFRDLGAHPDALGSMSVYHNEGRYDASNTEVRGEWVVRYQKGEADPALDHIDYGALALRREVVAGLPEDHRGSLAELQTELATRGLLRAFRVSERFYEIGSESGLRELARNLGGAGTGNPIS
jgi:MurNAc alpha-1-phosphate uridylyltransferase